VAIRGENGAAVVILLRFRWLTAFFDDAPPVSGAAEPV
jgi:hypothetical protein